MQPIVKFGLTKAGISSTLHTSAIYEPRSLGGILLFDPFVIIGSGQIEFLIKHYWKLILSIPLLWANLSTLKLEVGIRGHILENNNTELNNGYRQIHGYSSYVNSCLPTK